MTQLRGIVFDLDFTLLNSSYGWREELWPPLLARLQERYPGFDADEFERRMNTLTDKHYELVTNGEIDVPTYRGRLLREVLEPWGDLDPDFEREWSDARERAVDLVKLYDDAVETVRALRARGIKVGILTNGPSDLQRRKLRRIGIEDEVDAVAVSGELGIAKPHPEAFRRVADMLGLEPHELAMVGDHVENDIAGALGAGFAAAVWVNRHDGELPEGAHLAAEIAEVPRLLGLVE